MKKIYLLKSFLLRTTIHLVDNGFLKLLYKGAKFGIFKQINLPTPGGRVLFWRVLEPMC